jgi:phage terminase large subunit-like protein
VKDVVDWAESSWIVPETKQPIVLRAWQKAALHAMFPPDGSPSPWETFLISTVKKAGKTTLDAIATLYAALSFPAPETAYCVANDLAQAQERVFDLIAKQVRAQGLVARGEATVSADTITFPETGTRIVALPADFAGAAGAIFGITSWTELWAFRYEDHSRLWEELTPVPHRRSLRIVDSYAGFTGDSPILEPMWQRALAGTRLDGRLPIYANGRLWAFIDQGEEAQERAWRGDPDGAASYYAEQAASLRPGTYARLHLNQWQSGEEAFITAEDWDACIDPSWRPLGPDEDTEPPLRLSVGVDAATKHDCAAVVAVAHDGDKVRLVQHRIWSPRFGKSLDLEQTVERYLRHLRKHYRLGTISYDPFQMAAIAGRLSGEGLRMQELPQTSGNLTAAAQNLYELIQGRTLALYADKELRKHALNAVALETARGWRLAKEKSSSKIDGLAALSFACLDAIERRPGATLRLYEVHPEGHALSRGVLSRVF